MSCGQGQNHAEIFVTGFDFFLMLVPACAPAGFSVLCQTFPLPAMTTLIKSLMTNGVKPAVRAAVILFNDNKRGALECQLLLTNKRVCLHM